MKVSPPESPTPGTPTPGLKPTDVDIKINNVAGQIEADGQVVSIIQAKIKELRLGHLQRIKARIEAEMNNVASQ